MSVHSKRRNRFDAKKGFYLYPESGEQDNLELHMNRGSTYEDDVVPRDDISVIKCGLRIPNTATHYKDFLAKMKRNEEVFMNRFL